MTSQRQRVKSASNTDLAETEGETASYTDLTETEGETASYTDLAETVEAEGVVAGQHFGNLLFVVVGLTADQTLEKGLLEPLLVKNQVPSPLLLHLSQLLRHGTSLHRLGCNGKFCC